MKLVTVLKAAGLASLVAAAACDERDANDQDLRAQVDPGDLDGGAGDASQPDDRDHARDGGMIPIGMDAGDDDAPDAESPPDPACAELTYGAFGEPFIEKYCIGCHLGGRAVGGVDLSTLAGVREHADHVVEHAVETPDHLPMPPAGSRQPTAAERAKLGQWLRCGPK